MWIGRRHQGLGNELIPWAKAFIASEELGINRTTLYKKMKRLGLEDERFARR